MVSWDMGGDLAGFVEIARAVMVGRGWGGGVKLVAFCAFPLWIVRFSSRACCCLRGYFTDDFDAYQTNDWAVPGGCLRGGVPVDVAVADAGGEDFESV